MLILAQYFFTDRATLKFTTKGIRLGWLKDIFMIGRGVIANPELPGMLKKFDGEMTFGSEDSTEKIDRKKLRAFLGDIVDSYLVEMSNEKQVVMKMKELWTYLAKGLELDVQDIRAIHKTNRLADYKSVEQMILLR